MDSLLFRIAFRLAILGATWLYTLSTMPAAAQQVGPRDELPPVMTVKTARAARHPVQTTTIESGADAEMRAPMAIAVIGGLIRSTPLSLLYFPAFYATIDDIERFAGRHPSLRKPEPSGIPGSSWQG